ncbi:putative Acyl carrier protein (modular protein) [Cupriavidus taiwanensis]|nr:putative Acyl carrier protein (modular protein) [Cupriavidus taiwanensis]SOY66174.1 putative Acyl carrier protein (modular protein) [Cupriavidus taiwanensis]SOY94256.1 putative Acyl carrier protein (modular protein) [Cupriavidus taiwanensis]SOZ86107.1 putative Acyl carrier protein (modular protein) [Cupriavidus taiwanensis]SOZ94317.1 putative Acyl carrier protein (modular protein) [Cupriavidus taiwanensis]
MRRLIAFGCPTPAPVSSCPRTGGAAAFQPFSNMTELETELARLILDELDIADLRLEDITAATPLYGEGFGLDSIDILEIALLVSRKYGVELRSDNPDNKTIFTSLGSLAAYLAQQRTR